MIDIVDKRDCCGCTACASICGHGALEMQTDEEGFLYPVGNPSLCVECGLCERVCPIIARKTQYEGSQPEAVFALHNKNNDIWRNSSSGGVFASIASDCLKRNGIIYGAVYDSNLVVVHRGEETPEGVLRFRGSKYVQSDVRGVFAEIRNELRNGREVLFSGTPCQVDGLKRYLMKAYDNLTTVDILCHGVPSPKIFSDYVNFINKHSVRGLLGINMKDKSFGWGYQDLRLYFKGISEFNSPLSGLWNKIFYDHIANRPACHECPFTNLSRSGDLTIGDFWGIEKSHPQFFSDDGVSLMLVNSKKGMDLWKRIRGEFDFVESNTEECLQPVLRKPVQAASDRAEFWSAYRTDGFEKTIRKRYNIRKKDLLFNKVRQVVNILRKKS